MKHGVFVKRVSSVTVLTVLKVNSRPFYNKCHDLSHMTYKSVTDETRFRDG